MKQQKYNFVIMGPAWDLYKQSYADIEKIDNAIYVPSSVVWGNPIRRIYLSPKINKFFNLPFKDRWNKYYFDENVFSVERPLCFVLIEPWIQYGFDFKYLDYIRSTYKNAKIVWFLQDLYKYKKYSISPFDIVVSYDRGDCAKYGFYYHHSVFSLPEVKNNINIPESDVYFLAKAKKRLPLINTIYKQLNEMGLSCDFYLTDVPNGEYVEEGIKCLSKPFSYYENLEHANRTKCLLEIMQEDAVGSTFRVWESICFDKKLLSNNLSLDQEDFYDSTNMKIFRFGENMDPSVKQFVLSKKVSYKDKDFMSPLHLLDYIQKILNGSITIKIQ